MRVVTPESVLQKKVTVVFLGLDLFTKRFSPFRYLRRLFHYLRNDCRCIYLGNLKLMKYGQLTKKCRKSEFSVKTTICFGQSKPESVQENMVTIWMDATKQP